MATATTPPVRSYDTLIKEAQAVSHRLRKGAAADGITTSAEAVPETDPNDKGTVSVPAHPDGDNAKKKMIPDGQPTTGTATDPGFATQNPAPSGTDVPSTRDGDALDAKFTEPTADLAKCSAALAAIATSSAPVLEKFAKLQAGLRGGSAVATPAATPAAAPKQAAAQTPASGILGDNMIKLATLILSTERGVAMAEDYLREYAGVQEARALITKAASERAQFTELSHAVKQAAAQEAAAFDAHVQHIADIYNSADPSDRAAMLKTAQLHTEVLSKLHPDLHQYYAAGAADAAMTVKKSMAGEAPGIPGGTGDLDPAQLIELLQMWVESGQLDPALAEQVVMSLAGGAGAAGGAPPEGAMPPEAAAAPPAEEEIPEEAAKAASFALGLINSLPN